MDDLEVEGWGKDSSNLVGIGKIVEHLVNGTMENYFFGVAAQRHKELRTLW